MNRRAFLGTVPAVVFAGCAARLGLADRVEVVEKFVHVIDSEEGTEDGRDDFDTIASWQYDVETTPTVQRERDDTLAEDLESDGPLTISEAVDGRLESTFDEVRYGMRGCEGGGDCRETVLFLDDFNDIKVGDVVDIRFGDEVSGVVSIHERRTDRD